MSVFTGRTPTPVPRHESRPHVSSAIRREDPTDLTLPTHRPLDAQMIELREVILKIHDDMERDRSKREDEHRESQEGKLFLVSLYFLVLNFLWQVYRKSLRNSEQRIFNYVNF